MGEGSSADSIPESMISNMNGPTLLLPLEERNRELNSRAMVTLAAVDKGFDVILGQQWEIFAHLDAIPPSVVLFKGNNAIQARQIGRARMAGHLTASIEEEAFSICNPREILRCYHRDIPGLVDVTFTQGTEQTRALVSKWPDFAAKIQTVGTPRADILWHQRSGCLSTTARGLREKFGTFVLINTNFALINPVIDDVYGCFELCVKVGWINPNSMDDIRVIQEQLLWERQNFETTVTLALRLADAGTKVVIRPHPSEHAGIWQCELSGHRNIHIAQEGRQLDWLAASRILVQSGSTTGFEAFLMNHPTIALAPGDCEWDRVFISNHVNPVFRDAQSAAEAIWRHLDGSDRIVPEGTNVRSSTPEDTYTTSSRVGNKRTSRN